MAAKADAEARKDMIPIQYNTLKRTDQKSDREAHATARQPRCRNARIGRSPAQTKRRPQRNAAEISTPGNAPPTTQRAENNHGRQSRSTADKHPRNSAGCDHIDPHPEAARPATRTAQSSRGHSTNMRAQRRRATPAGNSANNGEDYRQPTAITAHMRNWPGNKKPHQAARARPPPAPPRRVAPGQANE